MWLGACIVLAGIIGQFSTQDPPLNQSSSTVTADELSEAVWAFEKAAQSIGKLGPLSEMTGTFFKTPDSDVVLDPQSRFTFWGKGRENSYWMSLEEITRFAHRRYNLAALHSQLVDTEFTDVSLGHRRVNLVAYTTGKNPATRRLVETILSDCTGPISSDAGAIPLTKIDILSRFVREKILLLKHHNPNEEPRCLPALLVTGIATNTEKVLLMAGMLEELERQYAFLYFTDGSVGIAVKTDPINQVSAQPTNPRNLITITTRDDQNSGDRAEDYQMLQICDPPLQARHVCYIQYACTRIPKEWQPSMASAFR